MLFILAMTYCAAVHFQVFGQNQNTDSSSILTPNDIGNVHYGMYPNDGDHRRLPEVNGADQQKKIGMIIPPHGNDEGTQETASSKVGAVPKKKENPKMVLVVGAILFTVVLCCVVIFGSFWISRRDPASQRGNVGALA